MHFAGPSLKYNTEIIAAANVIVSGKLTRTQLLSAYSPASFKTFDFNSGERRNPSFSI